MRKLDKEFEIRILVEMLYEKELINRATYLNIISKLNDSRRKAA